MAFLVHIMHAHLVYLVPDLSKVNIAESRAELNELGSNFVAEDFDWTLVQSLGIRNHCLKTNRSRSPTCGKILAHARSQITAFRESKGVKVCVFKVGVTSNPLLRFCSYNEKGFDAMWLIFQSESIDLIHMLEAACISHFSVHVGCRNQHESGGEGALNRANPPKGPFYLYVTGGRADQPRRIG